MDKINYQVIPHSEQRYPTVGDYWLDESGVWQIRVSKMSDWRYEILVLVHEICELAIVRYLGINPEEIDAFDRQYELDRAAGKHPPDTEPGDDDAAPYRLPHSIATGIERVLSYALMVNWSRYEEEALSL